MATLESGLDESSNLPARPSIASATSYSSCLDLSPLPEDVHLEVYGNSLRDINSFHSVSEGMSPTRKTFPRQQNIAMRKSKQTSSTGTGTGTGDRPRTAPADMDKEEDKEDVAKNSGLRSARYLAMQWRSRSTQWNASSSMHSFLETSTLPSSPPPALKEQTSDSDSDSIGNLSVDESIISQVSEARSFIDNWKLRASMSQESDDDGVEAAVTDSLRSGETEKMSRNLRSAPDNIISRSGDGDGDGDGDEFHIEKTFGFATREKIDERDTIRENASTTAGPRSQSSKKSTSDRSVTTNIDSQRTIKSSGGIHPDRRNNSIPVIPSTATTSPQKELLRRQSPRSIIVPPATTQKTKPTINHTTLEHQLKKAQSIQGLLEQLKKQGGSARQPKTKTTSRANEIKTPEPLKRTYPTPQKAPQKKIAIPEPTKTKPKPIKWDIYDFVFSFSLLTNEEKAPPPGDYIPDDEITSYKSKLIVRTKLLHDIMNQFAEALRKIRSLSNERGKFMMCPPDIVPNTKHVRRDGEFHPCCSIFGHTIVSFLFLHFVQQYQFI